MRMTTRRGSGRRRAAPRWLMAALALATLAGCGVSTVDEVRVAWPPFKDGTALVLPSDPAQCPDLSGTYRVAGEPRAGEAAAGVGDLRRFLAYTLDLPGLPDTAEHAWRPTPAARVTFNAAPQGWQVVADDGQGAGSRACCPCATPRPASTARPTARWRPCPASSISAAAPRAVSGSVPGATGASTNPWACSAPWRCCGHRRAGCW